MKCFGLHLISLLLITSILIGCEQMPREVLNKQLSTEKYFKEEMKGDVKFKKYVYYKPYLHKYAGKPYTGNVKDYDERGGLKSEGPMKDGFPHGKWVFYNSNGSLKSEGSYNNGVPDSIWYRYYTDGNPKLTERYTLNNDSLRSDTISAWFYNGQKFIETSGDTVRRYHKNGRLQSRAIVSESLKEVYMPDGFMIYRSDAHKKETFYTNGKLRTKMYYLKDKTGRDLLFAEKHKWTEQEKGAIEKADSILFDYSSYWDPVIKIYVRE